MELETFKDQVWELAKNGATQQELEDFVGMFYSHKPISYYEIEAGRFIARGRYNENGEIFCNKDQLSYIKDDLSKVKPGRANFSGQPVFYAAIPHDSTYSNTISTIMMEVALNSIHNFQTSREYFTVGRWRVKKPLTVAVLPFSATNLDRNPSMSAMREYYNNYLIKQFGHHPANQYFLDSLEYISDLFCRYDNRDISYQICAAFFNAICKMFSKDNTAIDGIVYPSANTYNAGINIALNTKSVDEKLELDWVQMIAMQRNPSNPYDLFFGHASDEQFPDVSGNFCFKNVF
ncbi:MAG: RES domain-containing protein [Flavipsychrobacter sp.]